MKNIKKIIIIALIFLIIIFIIITILKKNIKNVDQSLDETNEDLLPEGMLTTFVKEEEEYVYMDDIEILKNFFEYIDNNNTEAIISILDKNYKENNKIEQYNLKKQLNNFDSIKSFYIKEMYTQDLAKLQDNSQEIDVLKLLIRKNNDESNEFIIIRKDLENSTYSINIIDSEIYNNLINSQQSVLVEKINVNEYNKIIYADITNENMCEIFWNDYINSINNNIEKSYYLLSKDYREKRFLSIDEYIQYINQNKESFENYKIDKWIMKSYDTYNQYICRNNVEKYYIFNSGDFMNYSILLDEYTIDIPQFIEKYNNSDVQTKVALNIDKFIKGINDKNYNYSYSVLADSFKQNKYQSLNSFIEDVKKNFYDNSTVEYSVFTEQGSNYSYKIILKDSTGENIKNMRVIMKLGNGTDFKMSFSFEE